MNLPAPLLIGAALFVVMIGLSVPGCGSFAKADDEMATVIDRLEALEARSDEQRALIARLIHNFERYRELDQAERDATDRLIEALFEGMEQ